MPHLAPGFTLTVTDALLPRRTDLVRADTLTASGDPAVVGSGAASLASARDARGVPARAGASVARGGSVAAGCAAADADSDALAQPTRTMATSVRARCGNQRDGTPASYGTDRPSQRPGLGMSALWR